MSHAEPDDMPADREQAAEAFIAYLEALRPLKKLALEAQDAVYDMEVDASGDVYDDTLSLIGRIETYIGALGARVPPEAA